MAKKTDANRVIDDLTGDDNELRQLVDEETINAEVALLIYQSRMAAGLTQAELARMVGTQQPVIARLEDADYQGHSLSMLQRIASALKQRIEIRFIPVNGRAERERLEKSIA
jgi:transcriptional regulator with XRE-family HTH domain